MSCIEEKIYLLDDQAHYLAIGRHSPYSGSERDKCDVSGLYVYSSHIDQSSKLDLTNAFSLPWPVESHYVNEMKRQSNSGAPESKELVAHRKKDLLYTKPSYTLPTHICASHNNHVLIMNHNMSIQSDGDWDHRRFHRQRVYRLIHCLTGEIVWEKRLTQIDDPNETRQSVVQAFTSVLRP